MLAATGCAAARACGSACRYAITRANLDSGANSYRCTLAHAIARACGSAYRYAIPDALAGTVSRANLDSSANSYPCALAHSSPRGSTLACGARSSGDANRYAVPNALTGFQTDGNPFAYLHPRLEGSEHTLELDRAESAVD